MKQLKIASQIETYNVISVHFVVLIYLYCVLQHRKKMQEFPIFKSCNSYFSIGLSVMQVLHKHLVS